MTVIQTFAKFATTMQPPEAARHAAQRCLLDWYGAAIAGAGEAPATLLRCALPGTGPCRLIADGAAADPRTAALINGTASHIVEVDDIFRSGLFHPGVVTIPAAIALGEAQGIPGSGLLNAVIAGYEVSNRIARAVNPAHYAHWHTTATVGHFAAAVAGARALGLGAEQTAHAMATAATFAAGLRHAFSADAMSKPLHAGRAAEGGVLAALIAAEGVTGVSDMLEGTRGFGAAMSGDVDWDSALATLGQEWTITATTPKAHACCGHNFAALDAISALMTEHLITSDTIASIEVRTYQAALDICGNPDPVSAAEGRFSLPWCAASLVQRGAITPAAFEPDALADPATRALTGKITLVLDPAAEARFPHARSASVAITLSGGHRVEHHRKTRKGDPDDPLTDADLAAKFHALSDPVIGAEAATALGRAITRLDQIQDIREIPLGVTP